jgi:hypothetical protein
MKHAGAGLDNVIALYDTCIHSSSLITKAKQIIAQSVEAYTRQPLTTAMWLTRIKEHIPIQRGNMTSSQSSAAQLNR